MKSRTSSGWRIDTACVHAGEGTDAETRAIRRPIHMANSYELPTDAEELLKTFSWDTWTSSTTPANTAPPPATSSSAWPPSRAARTAW